VKHELRLRAEDDEDLKIIAAVLQDALIAMSDMEFLASENCFALVANRFRWENCDVAEAAEADTAADAGIAPTATADKEYEDIAFAPCRSYERVNCGIRFDGVAHVRCKGMDRHDRGRILELLTIQTEPNAVLLLFAGGAAVRLEGSSITCHLHDLGEPWPTTWRPRHPVADTA
jgi:Protein of unknown function (DUF2948)